MNGTGVPTQSQLQAASLTLSACNIAIIIQRILKKEIHDNATRVLVTV
jgi:hypothetical protein